MIRLITAIPGSGKTCLVVEWLIREVEKGFYKEFYTNIEGLRICGVRPLPDNCDWLTLNPDKDPKQPPKLVIIDECQYIDAFMKENRSVNNKIGKDLSTHRHYGIDIWFITQSVKLLNDYVLENVGEHVHLYRPRKRKSVTVYWWSYVQKSLTKSAFKDADDMQVWRLNPAMFDYYKSTSQVTDANARTSRKLVTSLITFVGVILIIAYFVSQGLKFYTSANTDDIANTDKAAHAITDNNGSTGDDTDNQMPIADDLQIKDRAIEIEPTSDNDSKSQDQDQDQKDDTEPTKQDKASSKPEPTKPVQVSSVPYVPPSIPINPVVDAQTPINTYQLQPYSYDNKPAMVFYNDDAQECIAKNKAAYDLNLTAEQCLEHLQFNNPN
ncbi:zonular occludens toxin domain-containing protein [Moraxella marmotae]|uniref:zonular occludens toxin domain-containing protein n=1 Tax=Moraxella marmotae TaxID=3344520 RepID=UPI0035F2E9E2